MERFPALRLILKYGRLWALLVAVLATGAALAFAWGFIGPWALALAPLSLLFFYFLAKSYVELIQIVVEMVH